MPEILKKTAGQSQMFYSALAGSFFYIVLVRNNLARSADQIFADWRIADDKCRWELCRSGVVPIDPKWELCRISADSLGTMPIGKIKEK